MDMEPSIQGKSNTKIIMAYYEDLAVTPNNFLKCILCDEVLENHDHWIESHLDSRQHKECHMKRLMTRNSLVIKNSELYCILCNHDVEVSRLIHHVESLIHRRNLSCIKEVIEKDGNFAEISDNKIQIHCCICNSQVDFAFKSVKSHIETPKHQRAKAMILQPLNGIFSVEDHDEYLWCKVCQVFFDNYVELIFQHVEESEHAKTMSKISRLIDGQNITIENYLQCATEDKALCRKCNFEVPCNVDNLQSHIRGKKHDSK